MTLLAWTCTIGHFPMKGKHFWQFLLLGPFLVATPNVHAQPPGFSPDAIFDRLDEDGSGVIEPEEIENSRMRFMLERMDVDISRGITRDDYLDATDRMRQRLEESGGWSGFRSRGDDDDRDNRGGRRSRWGRRDGEDYSRDQDGRSGSRSGSRSGATAKVEPAPRVTVDLPAEYVAGDADRDGQIGLYEWTRWKSRAALGTFLGLDRDGDGFLTPRELQRAAEAKPVDVATLTSPTPSLRPSVVPRPSTGSPDPGIETAPANDSPMSATGVQPVIAAADPGQVKQAERLFALLDRDRDGSISEDEWSASRRLKPRFEKAGADLAQPMSSDLFVSYYVRIEAADESI